MIKNTVLLLTFLLTAGAASAQEYSYVSDRIFPDIESFLGYDFKPAVMEIPNESQNEIDPGEYSFGITPNNLYVEGEDIRGVYTINNIAPEEYGFKVNTMNARDARIQGHLKIILNKRRQVTALIFRRSQKDPEIIFTLPQMNEDLAAAEKEYFTDLREMTVENADSLWGTEIKPFLRIYLEPGVQQRLQDYDSTTVSFIEVITTEEKVKKAKKSKKKKPEDLEGEEVTEESAEPEVKIKITKTYFVELKSLVRYDDGTEKIETERHEISGVKERSDDEATGDEEKFQIEFSNKKDVPIFLYLNANRQVSSMEIGDNLFFMRGI